MDQFVLIPQQLYVQKIRLLHQRLDEYNEKQDSVPKNLDTVDRKVNAKTKSSSNESLINEILNSPRIKLSLSDSIFFRRKRYKRCICRFCIRSEEEKR